MTLRTEVENSEEVLAVAMLGRRESERVIRVRKIENIGVQNQSHVFWFLKLDKFDRQDKHQVCMDVCYDDYGMK